MKLGPAKQEKVAEPKKKETRQEIMQQSMPNPLILPGQGVAAPNPNAPTVNSLPTQSRTNFNPKL